MCPLADEGAWEVPPVAKIDDYNFMIPTCVNYFNLWSIVDIGPSWSIRCTIVFEKVESWINSIWDNMRDDHSEHTPSFLINCIHRTSLHMAKRLYRSTTQ